KRRPSRPLRNRLRRRLLRLRRHTSNENGPSPTTRRPPRAASLHRPSHLPRRTPAATSKAEAVAPGPETRATGHAEIEGDSTSSSRTETAGRTKAVGVEAEAVVEQDSTTAATEDG